MGPICIIMAMIGEAQPLINNLDMILDSVDEFATYYSSKIKVVLAVPKEDPLHKMDQV